MWLQVIELLVGSTIELFSKKKEIDKEKRESLKEKMLAISDIINETVDELAADKYPSGKCAAMEEICKELYEVLSDLIPKEKAREITDALYTASRLEKEFANRKDDETLIELSQISGKFHAIAVLYS